MIGVVRIIDRRSEVSREDGGIGGMISVGKRTSSAWETTEDSQSLIEGEGGISVIVSLSKSFVGVVGSLRHVDFNGTETSKGILKV